MNKIKKVIKYIYEYYNEQTAFMKFLLQFFTALFLGTIYLVLMGVKFF